MKNFYLKLCFVIVLLATHFAHAQSVSISHNGINRSCLIHLPSGYSASNSYALVFNLHGYNSAAWQQQLYCQMDAVADTAKFIVAYPDAANGAWDTSFTVSAVDDPGFINALLDKLITLYSIDQDRVYACGLSMGGFMTYRIATEVTNRFAAVASVSGPTTDSVLYFGNFAPPIPVMHIHGTADSNVPYNGTWLFHPVDSTIRYWIHHNLCDTTPVVNVLPDINTSDNCNIITYCYSCTDSNEVLFYKVFGGGHSWPGGLFPIPQLGNMNLDINGSAHIWNFFNRHHRMNSTQGIGSIKGVLNAKVYPNPVYGVLHIELPGSYSSQPVQIEISDITGRGVQHSSTNTFPIEISTAGLAKGTYLLQALTSTQIFESKFSIME